MELDHVLIPLVDLSRAVTEFEGRYGLVTVEGGRHEDWGTANRIIPLGDSYDAVDNACSDVGDVVQAREGDQQWRDEAEEDCGPPQPRARDVECKEGEGEI